MSFFVKETGKMEKWLDEKGKWHSKWDKDKKRLAKVWSGWLKWKGIHHDGSKRNWIALARLEGFSPYTAKKFTCWS